MNVFIPLNIDVSDLERILSKDTINYVTTAIAEGSDGITKALEDALEKLPIKTDNISKLLLNICTSKNKDLLLKEMKLMDFIHNLPEDVDVIWGFSFDESLAVQQVKVSLIAASK